MKMLFTALPPRLSHLYNAITVFGAKAINVLRPPRSLLKWGLVGLLLGVVSGLADNLGCVPQPQKTPILTADNWTVGENRECYAQPVRVYWIFLRIEMMTCYPAGDTSRKYSFKVRYLGHKVRLRWNVKQIPLVDSSDPAWGKPESIEASKAAGNPCADAIAAPRKVSEARNVKSQSRLVWLWKWECQHGSDGLICWSLN